MIKSCEILKFCLLLCAWRTRWLIPRLWPRIGHGAPVPLLINRADAKEIIVFRHALHRKRRHMAYRFRVRPCRRGRVAPDDLIARQIWFLVRVPLQVRVV